MEVKARRLFAAMALCAALGAVTASVDGSLPSFGKVGHTEKQTEVRQESAPPPSTPDPTFSKRLELIDRKASLALTRANTVYGYVSRRADWIENQLSNVQRLEQQVKLLQLQVAGLQQQQAQRRRP